MATIEDYSAGPPPLNLQPELRSYLDEELVRIAAVLNAKFLYTEALTSAPAKPIDGLIVYADGTIWDPGSGEGFYGYENSAWVKL